jgi:hypothetical protein
MLRQPCHPSPLLRAPLAFKAMLDPSRRRLTRSSFETLGRSDLYNFTDSLMIVVETFDFG